MKVKYFIRPVRKPGSARVAHKLLLGWYLLLTFQSNSTGSCTNNSTQGGLNITLQYYCDLDPYKRGADKGFV